MKLGTGREDNAMKKTAILFDAGGILLDEEEMEQNFCDFTVNILNRNGITYSTNQYWKDIEESVSCFAPRTRPFIFWKYSSGKRSTYEKISMEFQQLRKQRLSTLNLMEGITCELKKLACHFSFVLAWQYGANIYELLDYHNIGNLFVNLLSQDDFTITKPDPRYLSHITDAAGFKTEECIMVGDRIDNDIVPAKSLKMGTVFIRTGIYKKQVPRDPYEIPDVTLDAIKGLSEAILLKWCNS